ncbi:MAG TPA: energy transducer TonB [Telluria sp.]|nr:energy transducer TonB [Telluria sp.]
MAVVGMLHLIVGLGLVRSMSTVHLQMPKAMETILQLTPEKPKPPEPPKEPPKQVKQQPKPLVIPKPAVDIPLPPPEQVIPAVVADQPPAPEPAVSGPPAPPADAGPVGNIGTAVMADGCTPPAYPQRALRNNESGTTTLALLIGPDGHVQDAKVSHGSGSHDLDRAALQALSMCKFKPAIANGQAQSGWARLDYVWTLEG